MKDNINPDHYKTHPSGVECIEISRMLGFDLGNAFKYVFRAGKKEGNSAIQDLNKALWYIRDAMTNRQPRSIIIDVDMLNLINDLKSIRRHEDLCTGITLDYIVQSALAGGETTKMGSLRSTENYLIHLINQKTQELGQLELKV